MFRRDAYFRPENKKMNRYADVVLALVLAFLSVQAQAGIVIGGTRVIYDGDKRDGRLGTQPGEIRRLLVQSWVDGGEQGAKRRLSSRHRCFALIPVKRICCALCAPEATCRRTGSRCSG